MADLIVARFDTQFAGMAILERLLARGWRSDQVALGVDESVGNSAASSSAPTTVISTISHLGKRVIRDAAGKTHRDSGIRSPGNDTDPKFFGYTVVTVQLPGELSADQVMHLLHDGGAHSVVRENAAFVPENPAMWPDYGHASKIDVQRAVAAVRGGDTL